MSFNRTTLQACCRTNRRFRLISASPSARNVDRAIGDEDIPTSVCLKHAWRDLIVVHLLLKRVTHLDVLGSGVDVFGPCAAVLAVTLFA
jgi:hypothetical protein